MSSWPYDPDTRALVARRLWQLLPAFYRVQDEAPRGDDELRRFLAVLGAPLAVVRQSVDELHANLFIDSCGPDAIGLLAEIVGTRTLFPDADTNRRDVRGTIAWRRRKGTPSMLEEMARELADELVVLQEGWRHVALSQDLDLLRLERVAPELRPVIVAETGHGPLDRMHHAVDIRSIAEWTGKYHPRQVTYWRHPTTTWPVVEGTAAYRGDHESPRTGAVTSGTDPDWRFAIHPLAARWALLARATGVADALRSDRIPAMHFASEPEQWFDREGRFTIHVASLPAAVADPEVDARQASDRLVAHELAEGSVDLRVLERERERWTYPVELALCVVDLVAEVPDTVGPGTVEVRSTIEFDAGSVGAVSVSNSGAVTTTDTVVMLRLTPVGAGGCFFPGASVAISGGRPAAALAADSEGLAQRGFLAGAMVVELPPTWVFGERWLYLAADGSVVSAQQSGSGAADVALADDGGERVLDLDTLLQLGPGAAWPPRPATSSVDRLDRLPPSPGRGPNLLHGGRVINPADAQAVSGGIACALELAARSIDAGVVEYRPLVRLSWTDDDPSAATWEALDDGGAASSVDARFAEIAAWRDEGPSGLRLAVRFVSSLEGARMSPSELAWTSYDGRTTLIHLPQLDASASEAIATWASDASYTSYSRVVEPAEDGASWWAGGEGLARFAEGSVAPLRPYLPHLRRRLRWRKLCPWDNEVYPGEVLPGTELGYLDVDVEHGLFALALAEPPQPWPVGPSSTAQPPNVTVDFEDGYSDHVGARPASREAELDARLPAPTRLISRSGTLTRPNELSLDSVPRYRSLTAALADIAADPAEVEVVQFEDSASYGDDPLELENPAWPAGVSELVIQAAEGHRPVLRLSSFTLPGGLSYAALTLRGLAWVGADLELPASESLALEWCSMLAADEVLTLSISEGAEARVDHCLCAGISASGTGTLGIFASAVDSGKGSGLPALSHAEGTLEIERSTVVGEVAAQVLHASEVLFVDLVTVTDRFSGCIRYSGVPEGCTLPRRHRVVEGEAPRFVSYDRLAPGHLRLSTRCPEALRLGAEDGDEIGVFHDLQSARRREALIRRLDEATPVGLTSGLVRVD
ncbi:hypothetical protein G6O69_04240 [Pseudenhygromyxa sp. WMMC2535]|uniref:hypothetical protein n=1 Tax=Pseudenhygromyxa sp. WMMC2535 TaxID=2712867 RepID=UPI0015570160|nr:hypothetical protein [Pseudenhygromyxa sp. WMMC2535]NVB37027.1 hypothetical protein [Pseudenhygromyxa sp. WMMC2535]